MAPTRRSFFQLLGSAYGTQLIPIVVLPVTTRLYTPAEFGDLLLFISWYTFIGTLATGKYDTTILVAEENELWAVRRIAATLVVLFASGFVALADALAPHVGALRTLGRDAPSLTLLFTAIMSFSAILLLTGWSNRCGDYRRIAVARLVQSVLTSLLPIGIYFTLGRSALTLPLSQVCGLLGAVFVLSVGAQPRRASPDSRLRACLRTTVAKYSKNSLYGLPHAVVDNAFPLLLAAVIGHWYGRTELGWYNICLKFKMPFTAAANSFGMLYQESARGRRGGHATDRSESARSNLKRAALFGLLLCPLLLLAPAICRFILGPTWTQAGYYALILAPIFVLSYLVGTFGSIAYLLNQQQTAFRYGVSFNIAQVLPFLVVALYPYRGAWPIEGAMGVSSVLCAGVLILHLRWLVRIEHSS